MPVYTYRREDGSTFDIRQKFLDDPLDTCPTTGQKVVRVVQPAGIIFKGSGFYVTDTKGANNPAKPTTPVTSDSGSSDAPESSSASDKKEKLTPDKITPIPEKPKNTTSAAVNQ